MRERLRDFILQEEHSRTHSGHLKGNLFESYCTDARTISPLRGYKMSLSAFLMSTALQFIRSKRFTVAGILTPLLFVICCQVASAQNDWVVPGEKLELSGGVPRIPASLAQTVKRYTKAYGLPLAAWDPAKREIWLKNLTGSSTSLYRIVAPDSTAQPSIYIPLGGVYDLYFAPQGKYFVYNRDADGNEAFQMYLYNVETRKSTPFTDGKSRNTEPVWSKAGDQIIYGSSPQGGNGVSLYVINPLDPTTNRLLAQSTGTYLKVYDWSPDDRQAVFCNFSSNNVSTLWLVDVATGEKSLLSPNNEKEGEYYDSPQFSKDSKGIYVITDRDSDIRRLAYLDLTTKEFSYPSAHINWDVEDFKIAPDGKTLAHVTNEQGISRLHLLDIRTNQEKSVPTLPAGIISDLKWHNNSQDLAFNFKSSRTPGDVYSLNVQTSKVERWAQGTTGDVDITKIPEPELVNWKSINKVVSGFLYRPPAKWVGKRPVIIDIHGGPEEQYRPSFWGEDNYLLNELGVAKLYPNVRGSSGYGRTFLNLDNGLKRVDAVKDIGALIEWIKTQPGLDAERVMVTGASYGGFMALSVATNYSDRIRAAQASILGW